MIIITKYIYYLTIIIIIILFNKEQHTPTEPNDEGDALVSKVSLSPIY